MIRRVIPVARTFSALQIIFQGRGISVSDIKQGNPWPVCVRTMASDHPPSGYVYPTMDDVPVPCGDWTEDYNNKQRKYNMHLIFGAGFFTFTCFVAYFSGLFWCNMFPPEKPGPRKEPVC